MTNNVQSSDKSLTTSKGGGFSTVGRTHKHTNHCNLT